MTFLVANLPPTKVWVKKQYLYDHQKGHGEFVEGVWVTCKSIQGRALYFETYLPECLFSNCSTSDNKILFASCFCSSPPIQEPTLITLILARQRDIPFAEKEIIVLIPNTDPGYNTIIKIIKKLKKWKVIENLVHNEYLYLLKNSQALLGNTSSGIREAPSYGIPFLSFGYRQENRERADNVIDLNLDLKKFDSWLMPEKILKFKS